MLEQRKRGNALEYFDYVQNNNSTDYVKDGKIYKNVPMTPVLVDSASDLPLLVNYEPGTIAYTAGFQDIWQKSPAGTWAEF